jgi:hypothetical protein
MELFRYESFMEFVYVREVKFPKELIFTTRNLLPFFFSHPRLFSFSACMCVCVGLYRMYPKRLDKFQERVIYIETKEKAYINIYSEIK